MEYPLTIYLSVGLFYALGILAGIGLLIKVWLWLFEQILILFKIKKGFIEFIYFKMSNQEKKEN